MPNKPSKSALKREHLARQSLGESLIDLSPEQLASIPLDDDLRDAIVAATAMRSHGALRRQKQLIGKLMRHVDTAPVEAALAAATRTDRLAKATFRRAESWRDRLMTDGAAALEQFSSEIGHENEDLRALLRDLPQCRSRDERRQLGRRIFRLIHAELETEVQRQAS